MCPGHECCETIRPTTVRARDGARCASVSSDLVADSDTYVMIVSRRAREGEREGRRRGATWRGECNEANGIAGQREGGVEGRRRGGQTTTATC